MDDVRARGQSFYGLARVYQPAKPSRVGLGDLMSFSGLPRLKFKSRNFKLILCLDLIITQDYEIAG